MASSIVQALNNLQKAKVFLEDFCRETKGGEGVRIAKTYIKKIDWIKMDFITLPYFEQSVRDSIRLELNSDEHQPDALYEKIMLINPLHREMIESILDAMINGEEFKIVAN